MVGLWGWSGCVVQPAASSTMPSGGGAPSSTGGGGGGGGNVTVPDVVGKTQSEADAAVASAGLRGGVKVDQDPGTWTAASKICTQTPGGGQQSAPSLFITVRMCAVEKPYVDNDGDLKGMTIEAAKQTIKARGYTGTVEVSELYEFDKDCKDGTVCRYEPRRWYLNQERRVLLMVNRTLSIRAPE